MTDQAADGPRIGLPDGTVVRVVRGTAGADELAALLLALVHAAARDAVPAPRTSAWRRAARLEGVGGATASTPQELGTARLAQR